MGDVIATQEWTRQRFLDLIGELEEKSADYAEHECARAFALAETWASRLEAHVAPARSGGGVIDFGVCVLNLLEALAELYEAEGRRSRKVAVRSDLFEEIMQLRAAGQQEYAGGASAFGNFERIGKALSLNREVVLWVYLAKHLDGIRAHVVGGHRSQREPVEGRIKDAMVYVMLLSAMRRELEERVRPTP